MSIQAVDITDLIRDTASGMSQGQMIHSANFTLLETINAICLMNPKIDVKCEKANAPPSCFSLCQNYPSLTPDALSPVDLLSLVDVLFSLESAHLTGFTATSTLFCSLYAHRGVASLPTGLLQSFLALFLKTAGVVHSLYFATNIAEDTAYTRLQGRSRVDLADTISHNDLLTLLRAQERALKELITLAAPYVPHFNLFNHTKQATAKASFDTLALLSSLPAISFADAVTTYISTFPTATDDGIDSAFHAAFSSLVTLFDIPSLTTKRFFHAESPHSLSIGLTDPTQVLQISMQLLSRLRLRRAIYLSHLTLSRPKGSGIRPALLFLRTAIVESERILFQTSHSLLNIPIEELNQASGTEKEKKNLVVDISERMTPTPSTFFGSFSPSSFPIYASPEQQQKAEDARLMAYSTSQDFHSVTFTLPTSTSCDTTESSLPPKNPGFKTIMNYLAENEKEKQNDEFPTSLELPPTMPSSVGPMPVQSVFPFLASSLCPSGSVTEVVFISPLEAYGMYYNSLCSLYTLCQALDEILPEPTPAQSMALNHATTILMTRGDISSFSSNLTSGSKKVVDSFGLFNGLPANSTDSPTYTLLSIPFSWMPTSSRSIAREKGDELLALPKHFSSLGFTQRIHSLFHAFASDVPPLLVRSFAAIAIGNSENMFGYGSSLFFAENHIQSMTPSAVGWFDAQADFARAEINAEVSAWSEIDEMNTLSLEERQNGQDMEKAQPPAFGANLPLACREALKAREAALKIFTPMLQENISHFSAYLANIALVFNNSLFGLITRVNSSLSIKGKLVPDLSVLLADAKYYDKMCRDFQMILGLDDAIIQSSPVAPILAKYVDISTLPDHIVSSSSDTFSAFNAIVMGKNIVSESAYAVPYSHGIFAYILELIISAMMEHVLSSLRISVQRDTDLPLAMFVLQYLANIREKNYRVGQRARLLPGSMGTGPLIPYGTEQGFSGVSAFTKPGLVDPMTVAHGTLRVIDPFVSLPSTHTSSSITKSKLLGKSSKGRNMPTSTPITQQSLSPEKVPLAFVLPIRSTFAEVPAKLCTAKSARYIPAAMKNFVSNSTKAVLSTPPAAISLTIIQGHLARAFGIVIRGFIAVNIHIPRDLTVFNLADALADQRRIKPRKSTSQLSQVHTLLEQYNIYTSCRYSYFRKAEHPSAPNFAELVSEIATSMLDNEEPDNGFNGLRLLLLDAKKIYSGLVKVIFETTLAMEGDGFDTLTLAAKKERILTRQKAYAGQVIARKNEELLKNMATGCPERAVQTVSRVRSFETSTMGNVLTNRFLVRKQDMSSSVFEKHIYICYDYYRVCMANLKLVEDILEQLNQAKAKSIEDKTKITKSLSELTCVYDFSIDPMFPTLKLLSAKEIALKKQNSKNLAY